MTGHWFGSSATVQQPPPPARLVELPAERYLVSWDRAHAQGLAVATAGWFHHHDLLADAPGTERLAGVVVMRARVVLRKTYEDNVELAPGGDVNLDQTMPDPDPGRSRSYRVLLSTGKLRACSFCSVTPGTQLCKVCGGTAKLRVEKGDEAYWIPCWACKATGTVTCGACDGRIEVLPARVRFVDDDAIDLKYTIVPNAVAALRESITEYLDQIPTFPRSLLFDFEQSAGYRSRYATEFHGYPLENAVARAKETLDRLVGQAGIVAQSVTSWVVPVALLQYSGRCVALIAAPDGSVVAVA